MAIDVDNGNAKFGIRLDRSGQTDRNEADNEMPRMRWRANLHRVRAESIASPS